MLFNIVESFFFEFQDGFLHFFRVWYYTISYNRGIWGILKYVVRTFSEHGFTKIATHWIL